jgi:plastocyanin
MKRFVTLLTVVSAGPLLSLLACEGEPPVQSPENTPTVASSGPSTSSVVASATPSVAPPPPTTACPPPPCAPVGPAVVAAGSASAGEASAPALPVPPQSIPRGNIVGSVTTKPASLAGQVVVYLEDGPNEDVPSHLQTVTIANRQMNFIPFVAVAAVGSKVVFTNEDPFPHNVFSPDNEKFNMGNIPQNGVHSRAFKNAGAYALLCNLHPGMLGYLVVTPSTWFARADAKGKFDMKHVPSGTYRVTAWAPRQATVTQSVTVADGDVTTNFDLHR